MPIGLTLRQEFASIKYAALLTAPACVLHTRKDVVVPNSDADLPVAKLVRLELDAPSSTATIPTFRTWQPRKRRPRKIVIPATAGIPF
jgi:hypothetical protein